MERVIVGVDPHKKSVTIEAIDEQGMKLTLHGRFGSNGASGRELLRELPREFDPRVRH